uniref:Gustatory receptor n=1 Tax=Tetranychus urticae TaxID=32264 RepID=T1KUH3_TETUR
MNVEEPVQENLLKKKSYFGPCQRLFLFWTELFCLVLIITINVIYACNLKLNSKFAVFALCRIVLNIILAASRFIIVLVLIKSKKKSSHLDNLYAIGVHQKDGLKRFITRKQLNKNIACSTLLFLKFVLHVWHSINTGIYFGWKPIHAITHLIHPAIFFFITREIIEFCINLQAAFKLVNSKVNSLVKSQSIDFESLIRCRRYYSFVVKATKSVENYFRYFVTFFYVHYAFYNIMNIVDAFGGRSSMDIYWIFHAIVDTLLMIYLTINLVSVNLLSRKCLDSLYELSFKMKRLDMKYENEIFIGRVLFTDVGFTFANLFTINTQFIASMLTLSFTIILALANFLYQ